MISMNMDMSMKARSMCTSTFMMQNTSTDISAAINSKYFQYLFRRGFLARTLGNWFSEHARTSLMANSRREFSIASAQLF